MGSRRSRARNRSCATEEERMEKGCAWRLSRHFTGPGGVCESSMYVVMPFDKVIDAKEYSIVTSLHATGLSQQD